MRVASWFGLLLLAATAACEPVDRKLGELNLPAASNAVGDAAVSPEKWGEPEVLFRQDSRVNSGLWVSDDGEVWITGFERTTGQLGSGFVARLVDGNLRTETTQQSELRSLWSCDGQTVHAVGGITTHSDEWLLSRTPSGGLLRDVWGADCDHLVAVGDDGAIARTAGGEWVVEDASPTSTTLNSVWGTSSDNIVAVGDRGTIVRFDGTTWSLMASDTALDLLGVWGASEIEFYAVGGSTNGAHAVVLEYDGFAWRTSADWVGLKLQGVHGDGAGQVLAVGGGITGTQFVGTYVKREHGEWRDFGLQEMPMLRDVWVSQDAGALAVGEQGIVARVPFDERD